jgi:hypothetical protein
MNIIKFYKKIRVNSWVQISANLSLQSFGQSAIIAATTSLLCGFFAVKPNETEP